MICSAESKRFMNCTMSTSYLVDTGTWWCLGSCKGIISGGPWAIHHDPCVVEDWLCLCKRRVRDWNSYLWRSSWVVVAVVQRLMPPSPRDCDGCSYTFCFETWSAVCTNMWPMYWLVGNWLKWPAWQVVFYKEMDLHMKLQLRMMCTFLQSDLLEMKGDETSKWYFICWLD